MKRICMFLMALLLAPFSCTADEVTGYEGWWTLVSVQAPEKYTDKILLPSQYGDSLPEIFLSENGEAVCLHGTEEYPGKWNYNPEKEIICIDFGEDETLEFSVEGNILVSRYEYEAGKILTTGYARKEETDLTGVWIPLLQTKGEGETWSPPLEAGILTFSGDGTGILREGYEDDRIENPFQWERTGNDVVISTWETMENGNEGYYPFQSYQLENGLLKRYIVRNEYNTITVLYGKESDEPVFEDIRSVRPSLNTAWELVAQDYKGIRVPFSMLGITREEYLLFFLKANGKLIHFENNEQTTLKFSFSIGDNSLTLNFKGADPVVFQYTDGQYLARRLSSGQCLYYKRKYMQEAQGVNGDDQVPMDLSISEPDASRLRAGGRTKFKATFLDTELVNPKNENDGIAWSLRDPDGREITGLSIDEDGLLIIPDTLTEKMNIVICARSVSYGTEAVHAVVLNAGK